MADTRYAAEDNIRKLAAKDPSFRQELISNPSGAVEKLFGGKLPGNVKVHVHEEKPGEVHIVVPAAAASKAAPGGAAQPHSYCSGGDGHSWSSCGYELTCYGPTCNSN